jgi:cell division protein FtsQ
MAAPARKPRRDPAPSRLRYRFDRLWLRPGVRRVVNIGLPGLAIILAGWTFIVQFDAKDRIIAGYETLREEVIHRPQFAVTRIDVPDVSADLAEQIRVAAFVPLPSNSLEVDVNAVRDRVEALGAVEKARVRVLTSGVIEIRATERAPVVVWRSDEGLMLLDQGGARVAEIDSRLRRVDLPLIAGAGAEEQVAEALALLAETGPVRERVRGLVRVGERRWDLVLDRDQSVLLPEQDPATALKHAMGLETGEKVFEREVTVIDLRDPRRPMLRLTPYGKDEMTRMRAQAAGEKA